MHNGMYCNTQPSEISISLPVIYSLSHKSAPSPAPGPAPGPRPRPRPGPSLSALVEDGVAGGRGPVRLVGGEAAVAAAVEAGL